MLIIIIFVLVLLCTVFVGNLMKKQKKEKKVEAITKTDGCVWSYEQEEDMIEDTQWKYL